MFANGKVLLALCVVCCVGAVTAQTHDDCHEESCNGVVCPNVLPCDGRYFNIGGEPCGCCPVCIKVENTGTLGVGVGKRCGPPTYLSCASYLECRLGICQYRKKKLEVTETSENSRKKLEENETSNNRT